MSNEIKYAGFWIRMAASILDFIFLSILLVPIYFNLFIWKNHELHYLLFGFLILYKPLTEYFMGSTLGKLAMRIKVTNPNMTPINLAQSISRNLPWIFTYILTILIDNLVFMHPAFDTIIGFSIDNYIAMADIYSNIVYRDWTNVFSVFFVISGLIIAFSKNKRGLHDYWAKTICTKK